MLSMPQYIYIHGGLRRPRGEASCPAPSPGVLCQMCQFLLWSRLPLKSEAGLPELLELIVRFFIRDILSRLRGPELSWSSPDQEILPVQPSTLLLVNTGRLDTGVADSCLESAG